MRDFKLPNQVRWQTEIASRFDPETTERLWVTARAKYLEISYAETHSAAAKEHLNAILPSIAFHLSAQDIGLSNDASLDIVKSVAMRNAKAKAVLMRMLKNLPGAFRLFRIFSPRVLKRDFAEAGFEVEWVDNTNNCIAFNIKKCLYVDLFRKYHCAEITPIFCAIDDYWYDPLAPAICWKRTGTLANGSSCCDFQFSKKRATFDRPSKRNQ